jgi:hypothetical protein
MLGKEALSYTAQYPRRITIPRSSIFIVSTLIKVQGVGGETRGKETIGETKA